MSANPVKFIVGSTRPEEKDILVKESSVYYEMGQLGPAEVSKATLKIVDSHVKKLTEEASELNRSITRLLLDHETELGEDRVGLWKAQQANI